MADRLERLRDRAHNQMLHIQRFSEAISEDTTLEDIKVRLEALETRYQTFNDLEDQLCDYPTYTPNTDKVDDIYFKTLALLIQASSSHGRGGIKDTHELNATLGQFIEQQKTFYEGVNTSQHVRLPKVNIEQFSGDYKCWASFRDLYITTIHNNHNISDVHKLQILKGLLSGEAAALIRHIPVTESNYFEAWDKICKRYNKMTPIITSLIQAFFDQKPCIQANGKELRRVTEASDEIIRGLRALGPDAETRDPWLIHILLNKIDSESKQLWANESVGKHFPKFETLLDFLNNRCDALEICDATKKVATRTTAKAFVIANSTASPECFVCKQLHPLFKCPVFKNKSVDNRINFVNERNLCRNCLRKGHISENCLSKFTCFICQRRHHSLLHLHQKQPETHPQSSDASSLHVSVNEPCNIISQATQSAVSTTEANCKKDTPQTVLHTLYSSPTTILPAVVVYVQSRTGKLQLIRALLDSGSQTFFVTESCAQRLGLKRRSSSISIFGLASTSAGKSKGKIDMIIHSRVHTF